VAAWPLAASAQPAMSWAHSGVSPTSEFSGLASRSSLAWRGAGLSSLPR
jgi:hypothetical protein